MSCRRSARVLAATGATALTLVAGAGVAAASPEYGPQWQPSTPGPEFHPATPGPEFAPVTPGPEFDPGANPGTADLLDDTVGSLLVRVLPGLLG